jgi:hypothetical protein
VRASAARTRQPIDSGYRSTSHDQHDADNDDPSSSLSLARLPNKRLGIWKFCLGPSGFLGDNHDALVRNPMLPEHGNMVMGDRGELLV